MTIFNSLGSNYDLGFAIRSLFANSKGDGGKLKKFLEEKYDGKAILTYKGREAIQLALRIINKPKEYTVGICGFTCIAVNEAIVKEGYIPEYLDIEKDSLNFSSITLEKAVKENPKLKIIIIQNTLGYPCEIEKIAEVCRENNIILIEDLAHSVGAKYDDGKEAGIVGDFAVFSFSQDKIIDGISGGGLVIRNSKFKSYSSSELSESRSSEVLDSARTITKRREITDRFYPISTFLIRRTYQFGIGKALHFFLKKLDLLSKPVESSSKNGLNELPNWYCGLIYGEFQELEKNIQHRKIIANIYFQTLSKKIFPKDINASYIDISCNLRFPVFVDDRKDLIEYLKKYGIYVSDIWYDAPIAPKKYLHKTNYRTGDCPNADEVSEKILNLPTHRNISEEEARQIAQKINLWMELQ